MPKVVHPNRLSLKLPASFSVEQTRDGFLVKPLGAEKLRVFSRVSVSLQTGQQRPEGLWPNRRHIRGRTVYYRIDEEEGGSGGETYKLGAWEPYSSGYILWQEHTQAESPLKPDFTLVWTIIADTMIADSLDEGENQDNSFPETPKFEQEREV